MQYIKLNSRGSAVSFLQEILNGLGYDLPVTGYFGTLTAQAVKDFQESNQLVVDGEVGVKTWTVLLGKVKPADTLGDKFLGEQDLRAFASDYEVELAAIKAVNEVESSGRGFLVDGRPKILFEGHVFWRQLKERGIDPAGLSTTQTSTLLYENYSKSHYLGGAAEYDRMEKAAGLSPNPLVKEATYASASWGSYQIMGYHAKKLGYSSVGEFVDSMHLHERNHLEAFGRYISVFGCLPHLRVKNWQKFANCYNGPAYKSNQYDVKMEKAYKKYSANN